MDRRNGREYVREDTVERQEQPRHRLSSEFLFCKVMTIVFCFRHFWAAINYQHLKKKKSLIDRYFKKVRYKALKKQYREAVWPGEIGRIS